MRVSADSSSLSEDGLLGEIQAPIKKKGFEAYGVDYSASAVEISRQIRASAMALPFKDNSLDFVFCINTLDHARLPKQVLQEAWRTLKPESLLLLDVNVEPLLDRIFMKIGYCLE